MPSSASRPDPADPDRVRPGAAGAGSVLARIIAAHGRGGAGKADLMAPLQTGLTRAIRRAALPFAGLMPQLADVAVRCDASLSSAMEAFPEHGLLAAIEDDEGRRGLIALDHKLVDALIEVQATGQVEDTDLPPRPVTRIDEALCRDFLDLVLAAFAKETQGEGARDWPDRVSYGSRIDDRAQLTLLLPEHGYHLLSVAVTMAGRKTGSLVFLLPSDPALARRRAGGMSPVVAQAGAEDWSARMLAALGAAPMVLNAVLMRVTLPLGRVQALVEGDLIPFTRADLAAITLEGEGDHVFARGGLGQIGGNRAVRFGGPGAGLARGAVAGAARANAADAAHADRAGEPATLAAQPAPGNLAAQPAPGDLAASGHPTGSGPIPARPLPAMAGFDPDAPMGGFDPDAPMG